MTVNVMRHLLSLLVINKMDSCFVVDKEIQKVLAKFADIQSNNGKSLQECTDQLESINQDLAECMSDEELNVAHSLLISTTLSRVKEAVGRVSLEHKDLHGSVSKVGKAIDRNFISDFSSILAEDALSNSESINSINHVVCEHFLRQGMLDIAQLLVEETDLSTEDIQCEPFLELHRILEALRQKNLQPALYWAKENRDRLDSQNSSLEFKLHKLQFLELVKQGHHCQSEVLDYAKHFAPFSDSHAKEIQVVMGTLLYMRQGLESSPYRHLLDPIHWLDICDVFTRDACTLLGLSVESPLSVAVKAGCAALPPLLNIKQVMQSRQCSGVWNAKDELPVEIDVGEECRFHSIFACPILRQQSSESNPPVRLVCGHVISRDALNKLASSNKVKCPYCPVEQSPVDARQIHL